MKEKGTPLHDAVVVGEEKVNDSDCWVVELHANTDDVSYQSMKTWVDKLKFIPLKEERFAKSGKLLKRTELFDIKKIDNRWYPTRIVFKDMLKKGKGTEFVIDEIEFDTDIPDHVFTKASLR